MAQRMKRLTVSITLNVVAEKGPVWWPAEIEVPESYSDEQALAAIDEVLRVDGRIKVTKLRLRDAPPDQKGKVIVSREPALVSASIIGTITMPHFRIVGDAA